MLALFGRSLGVRRLYVRVLLGIFQVHKELGFPDNRTHLFHSIFIPVCPNYMYLYWQYARRVARQHSHKHQRSFTIGSEGEETEAEGGFLNLHAFHKKKRDQLLFRSEDADVSISSTPSTTSFPSWTPSPCEEQTSAQDQVSWEKLFITVAV